MDTFMKDTAKELFHRKLTITIWGIYRTIQGFILPVEF
jgi:hypothetical protein